MDPSFVKLVLRGIPYVAALGLVGLFAYLWNQSRTAYSRAWQNLVAFSQFEADFSRLVQLQDLRPAMDKILYRLAELAKTEQAILYMFRPYDKMVPTVQRGFSEDFMEKLEAEVGVSMSSLLKEEPLRSDEILQTAAFKLQDLHNLDDPRLSRLAELLRVEKVDSVTVMALETPERKIGLLLTPHRGGARKTDSPLLVGFVMQLGATLEKYVLLHEAERRTKEFASLTEVARAVSSRLDPDDVLAAIHQELGHLFPTDTFYVAFQGSEKVYFEYEVEDGKVLPKRERPITYGFTEHIVRTGQPLLIEEDLETVRDRLKVVRVGRPAKCFCGVPIIMSGRVVGVMAAMHYEKEHVYSQRDLDLLQTAARQLAVSVENARLFAAEQKRSRYLAFLNNISRTAISSQSADEMMAGILREVQANFNFDHVGIGIIDYNTKEIEIRAEAGAASKTMGKRIPLGVGIMGRVARGGELICEQGKDEHLLSIVPEARSVLCIPITYSDSMLGILNIESLRENAFPAEDELLLQTLADLIATALHNVMVFQKLEQESITDALTGIKTRRYFNEALQSEFKRGQRSGRAFCVVLIDLDKFKEVNDGMGHLEGDLVLARIGRLLDQKVRQSNVVARYGGDEFIILMPETEAEQASILSERLRLWISTDPFLNERHITGSFGVAEFPLHGATAEDIVRVADAGMYISKRAGGNKVSSVQPSPESEAETELRQIIASYLGTFLRRDNVPTEEDILTAMSKISTAVPKQSSNAALRESVRSITRAVEARELHASGHGDSVASYAEAIAREIGMPDDEVQDLIFAAQVHDVGKIVVAERLLNKAGSLSFEEFQVVKKHPIAGASILSAIPAIGHAREFVLNHQERYDGTGYPHSVSGEEIPLGARIIAVSEAYVNMVSERPYATSKSSGEAMTELERGAGTQFDGMVVRVLTHQLKGQKSATTTKS
jgi:diguanylate cyclase (GGDEF)-like protein